MTTDQAWGTEIRVARGPIPFRYYEPRRKRLSELLNDAATWSDRVHLVQGERRLRFAAVIDAVERTAGHLWATGLRPGDRLLLLAPNSPEWVVSFWAATRLGAIPVLGNGWWSAREAAHAVDLVEPQLVVADPRRADLLPGSVGTSARVDITEVRAWVDGESSSPAPANDGADENDPAVIIFSAGTTGFPKAVTLAHRSVIANLHGLLAVSGRLPHQLDPARRGAVILQSGPLFHIGGIQSLLLAWLGGNTVVFLRGRFDAGEVLDLIENERVTVWGAIPTMASRVLEHPSLPGRDLSSVRSISMGGMPVLPELAERLRAVFPSARRGMSTIYGMTETGGTVASASGALMAEHPLTSGRPMPLVELRIDKPDASGVGEIVVRTPGQMLGYWGDDSTPIIDADGWLHTGDLGRFEDGLLWLSGRSKDVIIRGGENVAAAHVEQELLTHPDVAVVAVVGLPDADLGERVGAVVQRRSGSEIDAPRLAAYAADRLARFEVPSDWWIRDDEIPMSDAGKIEKHKLVADWLSRSTP